MNYVTPEIHIISLIDETIQIGKKDLKVFVVSRDPREFSGSFVGSFYESLWQYYFIFTSLHFQYLIFYYLQCWKCES